MKTIKHVVAEKGNEIKNVKPDTSAIDAIKIMVQHNIGSLLVIDESKVVGIFTEKDFSCRVVMQDQLDQNMTVAEVMTTPVIAIHPEQSIEEGMAVMTEKRVRHLPVMDHEELIGLVSIGDLVKAIIQEQQFTIEQLEHYIHY